MMTLCVAAGFQPTIAATVDDIATALGLVSIGWGVTVAPDLTPANPERGIQRIRLNGLEAERHSILIVRDGEESLPHISAVIEAVHRSGSKLFHQEAHRAAATARLDPARRVLS